jgi:hypothetical protein
VGFGEQTNFNNNNNNKLKKYLLALPFKYKAVDKKMWNEFFIDQKLWAKRLGSLCLITKNTKMIRVYDTRQVIEI